jgi:hypothetical protein
VCIAYPWDIKTTTKNNKKVEVGGKDQEQLKNGTLAQLV